jgi:hypothetical protein
MKRVGLFLFAVVAIALMFSASAWAVEGVSTGDNSYYFVTYYSNNVSGAPDATLRFINDGSGLYESEWEPNLWADIYVFDDSQELVACGACEITADGLLSEDVKTQLTNNPITGRVPSRGVIKVISDPYGDATYPYWASGLRGWATHIQATGKSTYSTTEAPVADSNFSQYEWYQLGNLCYYAGLIGSGQGTISCTLEDHDF